jgi:hypothetical protein
MSPSLSIPTGRLAIIENGVHGHDDDEEEQLEAVVDRVAEVAIDSSNEQPPVTEDEPVDER